MNLHLGWGGGESHGRADGPHEAFPEVARRWSSRRESAARPLSLEEGHPRCSSSRALRASARQAVERVPVDEGLRLDVEDGERLSRAIAPRDMRRS